MEQRLDLEGLHKGPEGRHPSKVTVRLGQALKTGRFVWAKGRILCSGSRHTGRGELEKLRRGWRYGQRGRVTRLEMLQTLESR